VLGVKLAADGVYGSGTQRAVTRFQRLTGLKRTGAVDRATWVALLNASAAQG
jgi:peptidoglycan hydrolase-like protein with peptidoglycan-binding domain